MTIANISSSKRPSLSDRVMLTAVDAARRAGIIQMNHFRNPAVRYTRLLHDVKLETDRLCEEAIVTAIRESFPDHTILAEESGASPGSSDHTWIIDPLDGTVNFWHGLPFFCVSIACYRGGDPASQASASGSATLGKPVVGVIYLPFSEEMFVAMPGSGAFLNQKPIQVSPAEDAADVVVTVSFGKTPEMMQRMTRRLDDLLPRVRKARCLGAAAAELAYVAAGFLGGVAYEGLRRWDFAAGKIILEEAGGFFEATEIEPDLWKILAGIPPIHKSLASVPNP
jgi:myo-inositol-1(or 4)-monophosphatase